MSNKPVKLEYRKISISERQDKITFSIPHSGREVGDFNYNLILGSLLILVFFILYLPLSDSDELSLATAQIIRLIILSPLFLAASYLFFTSLFAKFGKTIIHINFISCFIEYQFLGIKRTNKIEIREIEDIELKYNAFVNQLPRNVKSEDYPPSVIAQCFIVTKNKRHQFGRYILREEKEWLVDTLKNSLNKFKKGEQCPPYDNYNKAINN